jgi:hypothetical protein
MCRKLFFGTLIGCLFFGNGPLSAQPSRDLQDQREKSRERIQMVRMLKLTEALKLDREAAGRFFAVGAHHEEAKRRIRRDLQDDIQRLRTLTRDLNAPERELRETVLRIKNRKKDLNDQNNRQMEEELGLLRPDQQARYILFTIDFHREMEGILREVREGGPVEKTLERWPERGPRPPMENYKERTR